ncbi:MULTISPECIES: aldo/keto reductase [unclassified Coleofasciculus]|uniref:aldo/keto reductase n=1 Tax=unclassified Coleofasciculus TaxID=2692782 RepID=UPI0018820764|nr:MULTISPECIES: aldo/keto reductase [unclassified Coleofasciculus]MBE9126809.1 aldo/keto reductase [Coleofasciculus sp. LEGE 07081]MBE9150180.1 aldo/keto reductase [Coleofasciculus sp. LEGE 07092]
MIKKSIKSFLKSIGEIGKQPPKQSDELIAQINQTTMEYTTLGRTGLRVSVAGLGGGGYSKIGQSTDKSQAESIYLIRTALDFGINLFDTAEDYDTEQIIGKAIKQIKRENVVLSTKKKLQNQDRLITGKELAIGVEKSLRKLQTDYVDIYNFHGVNLGEYEYVLAELVPVLFKMRDAGKIQFIGITEAFTKEPNHKMLRRAVEDDCWDTIMVGFNILNQSARELVLSQATAQNIGVLSMFAVRRALSSMKNLRKAILKLQQMGYAELETLNAENPLDFLFKEGGAKNITDAAYRFCRHQAEVDAVLFGTGNVEHLTANVASLLQPPLPEADLLKLKELFANVDNFTGHEKL